jgi:uncharacterized protein YjiS (DUF1127 family)
LGIEGFPARPLRAPPVHKETTMTTTTTHGIETHPGFVSRMKTYIARSRAERQLRQLDDRLLADIGVSRSDITRMVWGN